MNTVLLHDWLTGFRGGERVLEAFCELNPKAPIYTLLHTPGQVGEVIEKHPIHKSFLNNIPGAHKHYRKLLPLMPKAAENIVLPKETELVLSSSHCVIKGVPKPPGSLHISYIHSPMRYLYDQYDIYFGPGAPLTQRLGMKLFRNDLTKWDLKSNANVDHMIANSAFVRERIRRIYDRDAEVIHPFVELKDFAGPKKPKREDFHLMVTAFAPNKRVDIAIEAFRNSGRRLKIIGSGQQEKMLKSIAGPEIEFLGNLSRTEVIDHFFRAQSLIFPGVEDFGITPLEALAAGTPVVAFHEGGVLETLNEHTAEFFEEPTAIALRAAVDRLERRSFNSDNLEARASEFSREKFQSEILATIKRVTRTSNCD